MTEKNKKSVINKIKMRIKSVTLRLNKLIIFNNKFRMWVYKSFLGLKIGKKSIIWAGNRFNDISDINIGNNVIIGPNNVFLIRGGIDIGNNVNISGFSFFISQSHDYNDPYGHTTLAKIIIKDNVWIATSSIITSGVTIGEGAVVGAGSVVVSDVPDYSVVAGNPAVVIRKRDNNVKYLLNDTKGLKWL